jgi:hypothetical protein
MRVQQGSAQSHCGRRHFDDLDLMTSMAFWNLMPWTTFGKECMGK